MDKIENQNDSVPIKVDVDTSHYYGDYIRKLFFAIGIIMLLGMPIFSKDINLGAFTAVLGVLVIDMLAGMTSPKRKIIILFDALVSLLGTAFFELYAFFRFDFYGTVFDGYFLFNQIIAVLFFVALYLSIKTFRGAVVNI